jgi:REP element-mobilizing transposase RayT
MPNTYTQLCIQLVFAVKGRQSLVKESFRDELEKYICGTIREKKHKPLAIYCMPDHTHILVGLNPSEAISTLVQQVKANSSGFINERKLVQHRFNWQEGYGAFSYARSQVDAVVKYISNQPEHHRKKTFQEEYLQFLDKFEIDYRPEYLFEWIEPDNPTPTINPIH